VGVSIGIPITLALAVVAANSGERTWERCIEAKGGREALASVRNVLVSSTSSWRTFPFKRVRVSYEELYVLPDKMWLWSDERPTVFDLVLEVVDRSRGFMQMAVKRDVLPAGEPSIRHTRELRKIQAVLFLQTSWNHPQIVSTSSERKGRTRIKARLEDQGVEYVVPTATYLPERVDIVTTTPHGPSTDTHLLSDYRQVSGIMLPHKITTIVNPPGMRYTCHIMYSINVDHDPDLFNRAPSIESGPKGWMRKP
jgi:hypothetical protein